MPVHRCWRDGERGWQWGDQKCYIPSEEGSDDAAREKAEKQGRAIESRREESVSLSFHQNHLTIRIILYKPRFKKKSATPFDCMIS